MMVDELLRSLAAGSTVAVSGLRGSSPAWLCSQLIVDRPCCCILPDEEQVSLFEQDLRVFTAARVISYPGYEIPPYTPLSPDQRTTAARLAGLYELQEQQGARVFVTSIEALMRRVMPRHRLTAAAELLMAGEDYELEPLLAALTSLGYEQVSLVQNVGDYAVRGGILDLYPPPFPLPDGEVYDGPLRLDFFGDTIESIRTFDPISQRSSGGLPEAVLLPVHDVIGDSAPRRRKLLAKVFEQEGAKLGWDENEAYRICERLATGRRFAGMEFFLPLFYHDEQPRTSTVFDFLPQDMTCLLIDPEAINERLELLHERIATNYQEALATKSPALATTEIFLTPPDIRQELASRPQVLITDFPREESTTTISLTTTDHRLLGQEIAVQRTKRGLISPLSDQLAAWAAKGERVIICGRSPRHTKNLAEMLGKSHGVTVCEPPVTVDAAATGHAGAEITICNQPLARGFTLPAIPLHVLSESELFGEMRLGGRKRKSRPTGEQVRFSELRDGDVVVHRDHGLGIYQGMQTITVQNVTNDFMLVEYRDGDKLYLPVDRLNLISRYEGLSDRQPRIDKLGTQHWRTVKAKVKEEVWKVAHELLDIYAKREIQEGHRFSTPGGLYGELEESFPYDETPGQDQAINDVLGDLTSDKPMDRLVCGDVGYGKTEVAIRAAFKAVEDSKQVAVLVPTTVLAEQHTKTFRERLAGFPVTIESINRFRTPAQQREITSRLKKGEIDILIGTHRLLSKDIQFKDLGLLIVDEEHRFGVSHKEKIKKMRAQVDILTLTATPIPRTLQMSLLGIRDLSVISSPPEHRRPVKTFIARYDKLVIKEAITRELHRRGQVFFIHNRVKSIHRLAGEIQELVPTARVAVAHGQMVGKELEEIMVKFVNREIDVLVSTTIVESGLDIPSANTIVINRADMLGLAEIYQLRGRVGRSSTQSFAYLLVPSIDSLSKDSRDRLRALMDCNELGGGFKLAMNDLQIRGGGNLLGVSQSGHIAAIGYDLYLDLLQKTVADLKSRALATESSPLSDEVEPEINLQISAYIPERYIADISQRYLIYRRIAHLASGSVEEQSDLQEELEDRYGPLPEETRNLFQIVALKLPLSQLRITKLEKGRDTLVFSFQEDTPVTPERLLHYLQTIPKKRQREKRKLTPDGRLVVTMAMDSTAGVFNAVELVLRDLKEMTHD